MIHVIIPTCDKYSVIIPKTLAFFYRHWPSTLDHRITVIGVTRGTLNIPVALRDKPVHCVYMLRDRGWAENLLTYLATMQNEPFLMMMDDHILFEANEELIEMAQGIITGDDEIGCVRLVPWPGPTIWLDWVPDKIVRNFGEIDKSLEYAISLQASFWKPQTLRDILDPSWNPWEVELKGSQKARAYGKRFIGCKTCAVNYKDYFMRGKPREGHAAWVDANL